MNRVPNNQICWSVSVQVPQNKSKGQHFKNSEWGPEAIDAMISEFQDLPCAFSGIMKDMFDTAPKNLISKGFLEEKVFQTWYSGRSVLIGDACHKILPGAGQGAVMAMKDAVVLANCLYGMKDRSSASIRSALDSYYKQRFPEAEAQLKNSANLSELMSGQRWHERLSRYLILKYTPYWLMEIQQEKDFAARPQINWLPLVESQGTGKVLPQVGREEAVTRGGASAI
ncbi:hypothetical protein BGZ49_000424 [Haplosporangium sp. Z 27]|nr:hypothetical protein BGZ49_000424 [Haplosporangium sp. Z 27]